MIQSALNAKNPEIFYQVIGTVLPRPTIVHAARHSVAFHLSNWTGSDQFNSPFQNWTCVANICLRVLTSRKNRYLDSAIARLKLLRCVFRQQHVLSGCCSRVLILQTGHKKNSSVPTRFSALDRLPPHLKTWIRLCSSFSI